MGYTSYSVDSRTVRATTDGFFTKSAANIFTQSAKRTVHESMSPKGITFRECRDSEAHPFTVPIILGLDVTGSMGRIPHELIKDGLPTLMGSLIQNGVSDASLMFVAVGDHEYDRFPLQVAQFESGDAELDMWLTRTYLEGGGGGNAGESYHLAWYFASQHTKLDSLEKRGKKGFLFTVGDEPCLTSLPGSAVREIIGEGQKNYSAEELLKLAQEKFHVFHLHVIHGDASERAYHTWTPLLGQHCIRVEDYTTLPRVISDIILSHSETVASIPTAPTTPVVTPGVTPML